MWVPVQVDAVKALGHQDQECEYTSLPRVLEPGSAAVVAGPLPGGRPAGA